MVEPAIAPERKSFPNGLLIVPLFLTAGLFAGCLLALLGLWWEGLQSNPGRLLQLQELEYAFLSREGGTL